MLSFLGWIPVLGPIIDGGVAVFKSFKNTELEKYRIDGQVNIEAMKAGNELTLAFISDIGIRLARDIILFPACISIATVIWDRWIAIRHPELVWGVLPLTGALEYLPFAVLSFLFGSAWINRTR